LRRLIRRVSRGPDLAAAIRAARQTAASDARAAKSAGLDFVPLVWEDFDL